MHHARRLSDKTHAYTVPKLFLFELLPDVECALTLDADVIALSDVSRVADDAADVAVRHPSVMLLHAAEQ